jgi:hypothetical protein
LQDGVARLVALGLDALEAKALLRSAIHGSFSDASLERKDGDESVGDAMTIKDLSLIEALC